MLVIRLTLQLIALGLMLWALRLQGQQKYDLMPVPLWTAIILLNVVIIIMGHAH